MVSAITKNIRIILVEPEISENIGLSARAMKNTGFGDLVVVKPRCGLKKSADVAKRARDICEQCRVVDTLAEAYSGCTLRVGTTRRQRSDEVVYRFEDTAPYIVGTARKNLVALVFGPEKCGLSKEVLRTCNLAVSLEASPALLSYNLSHSVAIICYTLMRHMQESMRVPVVELAPIEQVEFALKQLREIYRLLPGKQEYVRSSVPVIRDMLERRPLTAKEANALNAFLQMTQAALERPMAHDS